MTEKAPSGDSAALSIAGAIANLKQAVAALGYPLEDTGTSHDKTTDDARRKLREILRFLEGMLPKES